ncbi:hypothetical protein VNO77_24276 [Canavalia gladiata]|uniref:Phytocyanin domain-containing protein n=1 Tax=Canavalia gladiata TaxID=3824 RepID=A0AAN9L5Z6_CANGL
MAQIIKVATLFLLVAETLIMPFPQSTEAAEHVVNWIIPPNTSFYPSFAANQTFTLKDILVFEFKTGAHNVVTLSKKNLEGCNVNEKIESYETGPARITLNRSGEFYFACAVGTHCSLGQKLSINVTASLAPAQAPPPSPGAPISIAVTIHILLIAIAINLLF